jgi:hypothetical protein
MKLFYNPAAAYRPFTITFEGEDEGAGDPPAGNPPAGNPPAGNPPATQSFTQEQVNSFVAQERRKVEEAAKQQNADTLNQLKMLQTKANLSEEERTGLESQISELNKKVFTAEELAGQERKKLNDQHKAQLDELTADRDGWQGRFTEATISRNITDAAVKHDAFNPNQIVAVIRPQTRLTEVKDEDGNVLDYAPMVTMKSLDKDGKPIELELTVDKAVEQMKENEAFFNLFKGKTLDGLGAGNNGQGSNVDTSKMTMDQYKAYRKKEKAAGRL